MWFGVILSHFDGLFVEQGHAFLNCCCITLPTVAAPFGLNVLDALWGLSNKNNKIDIWQPQQIQGCCLRSWGTAIDFKQLFKVIISSHHR